MWPFILYSHLNQNMIRACMSSGVDIGMKYKDGKLSDNGFAREPNYITANIILQIANSTEITFVRFMAECIDRFAKNESDFSIGSYDFIREKQPYYVPCPSLSSSLHFISGYEDNKYQATRKPMRTPFGVLNNMDNFCPSLYAFILIWLMTNFILVSIKVALRMKKPQKNVKKLFQVSFKLIKHILRGKSPMNRIISFFLYSGLFFISTPFLLLFKTNQVITPKQPFLANYEQVIARNAQVIYSSYLFDETILLEPSKLDEEPSSIQSRFWRHFKSNSHKVTFGTSLEDRTLVGLTAKSVVEQRSIFLASFEVAYPIMQTFCSWSEHPDLYRMFVFHDANQREILTGFALRMGFQSKKLVKRIRNTMEFHIYQHIPFASSNYADVPWKLDPVASHKQLQLSYCQERSKSSGQNKSQILKASGVTFFDFFFRGLAILIIFASLAFLIESTKVHKRPTSKVYCSRKFV